LPIVDPQKCYNSLSPPYSPVLSPPDYFLFLKLKIKLKGLHFTDVVEIQAAVTDELKKVQKEEFSAEFQKPYDCAEPVYMPVEFILNLKKKLCFFLMCLRF
jgi:hypothetical protein